MYLVKKFDTLYDDNMEGIRNPNFIGESEAILLLKGLITHEFKRAIGQFRSNELLCFGNASLDGISGKSVERISSYFLENLRKKCDLHPEVGFCFCAVTQTYRIRPEPTSFFYLL